MDPGDGLRVFHPGGAYHLHEATLSASATLTRMPVEIDVDHVARLARLALTDEERERFGKQLALILENAERVRQVAAADIRPTAQPVPQKNVFRNDDDPWECLPQDQALAGAPEAEDGRFKVPRITEGE
jgi:aspartyl-tRNA(Asn)/glutamyl-tRNA(Gln) amidotransferase subunit C